MNRTTLRHLLFALCILLAGIIVFLNKLRNEKSDRIAFEQRNSPISEFTDTTSLIVYRDSLLTMDSENLSTYLPFPIALHMGLDRGLPVFYRNGGKHYITTVMAGLEMAEKRHPVEITVPIGYLLTVAETHQNPKTTQRARIVALSKTTGKIEQKKWISLAAAEKLYDYVLTTASIQNLPFVYYLECEDSLTTQ